MFNLEEREKENTPVQRFLLDESLSNANSLYIKRDDLIPYAFGGNKVRLAKEFIKDMRANNKNALIMYGDLRSNLCRVLGFMCKAQSIPCLMVATSENGDGSVPLNEHIVKRLNIEVLACPKNDVANGIDKAYSLLESRGLKPYYIYGDRTGEGNEGTAANAYALAYQEITAWEAANDTKFDYIFAPYGTGGTLGGLICGHLQARDSTKVVGISISSRSPERAYRLLKNTVEAWYAKTGKQIPADFEGHIHLETKYNCGGYGMRDKRVNELIESVLLETSIPTDPTYTGKAMRGMLDYLKEHDISGKNILYIHTGGLPLFFDYLQETR